MMALTLHRPWAWAVVHADKRVENRTWRPPPSIIGQRIAIHAGKKWDEDAARLVGNVCGLDGLPPESRDEGIVGTARVVGVVEVNRSGPARMALTAGEWNLWPVVNRIWFSGPIGWLLNDVRALPMPIPVRGRQGLWSVPPPIDTRLDAMCAEVCDER